GLVADLAAPAGIVFPPPSDAQRVRLGESLGPLVAIANPLEYHTFIWGDGPRTTDVFSTMLGGYDAGIFIIDPPRPDRCDPASFAPAIEAILAAQAATGKPAFPVSSIPENFGEDRAGAMLANGVVAMMGLETALGALRAAQIAPGRAGWRPLAARPRGQARMLAEDAAKAMLAGAGVAVPRGVSGATLADVQVRASSLAAPLALKGLGFAHKTEAGAVRLGLASLDGQAAMPGAAGYLAEEMVLGGVAEVLLGLRRDPVYGVTLTLGMGGVTAELMADTVTLVAPVTGAEIAAALKTLRLWPLLDGYRGRAKADVAAFVDAALALQALMVAAPHLQDIEINPLMLRESGAVAADAVIWEDTE
ncbi:MAG: acetate--CoA ligase family protein, partial [Cereibacter sp.]